MINDVLLLESLKKFYGNEYYKKQLLSILKNERNISLRSIDWFITNYSKKKNIYYLLYETPTQRPTFNETNNLFIENLNVYHSYKSQLKAYSKKKFDPFCRRDRILFEFDKENSYETTIGQLNFFRWALSNLIIDYIEIHKKEIEDDMNTCLKTVKKDKKTSSRKKREELSLSATRGLSKKNIPVQLMFD
jgi:hypothetical protein